MVDDAVRGRARPHVCEHPRTLPPTYGTWLKRVDQSYVDTLMSTVERRGTTSFIGVYHKLNVDACLTRSLSLVHDTGSRHALLQRTQRTMHVRV
jgi:hypothetical protein